MAAGLKKIIKVLDKRGEKATRNKIKKSYELCHVHPSQLLHVTLHPELSVCNQIIVISQHI